ncbi:MAG TPA: helix-turn-helix transcriptional regulator, partial [Acidimicrobiales bacterium]|nr:helix-turn-helix transcriptional regulator [Acidimicrobiales bacterium]
GALAQRDGAGLDGAAARFAALGARLPAAEAAAAAAEVHRDAGRHRDLAASLAQARRLAAQCENAATPLLARLDRAPAVSTLTDREREIAGLAARGRTSPEIATALTISVRTVESHLNHTYVKLGIRDRGQLAAALGDDTRR